MGRARGLGSGALSATTGAVRVRAGCLLTALDGAAASHHPYDDRLDPLGQLGLGEQEVVLPERTRAQAGATT